MVKLSKLIFVMTQSEFSNVHRPDPKDTNKTRWARIL